MFSSPSLKYTFFAFSALILAGCTGKTNTVAGGDELTQGSGGAFSLGQAGENGASALPGTAQDFTVNLTNTVYFSTDSSELSLDSRTALDHQAAWMATYEQTRFSIQGHADERGTREYNISLSAQRANRVRDYLISKNIDSRRLSVIAYGKEKPVEVCPESRCWNLNRRAETVIEVN